MAKLETNDMPEVWALYSFYIHTVCYVVDLPAYCNKNKNYIPICGWFWFNYETCSI